MPVISVRSNAQELLAGVRSDQAALKDKAVVRALNKTGDNVRAEAVRQLRARYTITAGALRDAISVRYAWSAKLSVEVTASGAALPLAAFAARQTKAGVSFGVKRGARKTLAHTFLATMRSGHKGVFERVGSKRLPIAEKFTIGIPGMFGAKQVQDVLASIALDKFTQNLESQLDLLFRR